MGLLSESMLAVALRFVLSITTGASSVKDTFFSHNGDVVSIKVGLFVLLFAGLGGCGVTIDAMRNFVAGVHTMPPRLHDVFKVDCSLVSSSLSGSNASPSYTPLGWADRNEFFATNLILIKSFRWFALF